MTLFPLVVQDHYGRFYRVEANGTVVDRLDNAHAGYAGNRPAAYPLTAVLQNGKPTGLADPLATRVALYLWQKGRL